MKYGLSCVTGFSADLRWASLLRPNRLLNHFNFFTLTAVQPKKTAVLYQCCQGYFQITTKWCGLVLEVGGLNLIVIATWVAFFFPVVASYLFSYLINYLQILTHSTANRDPGRSLRWIIWKYRRGKDGRSQDRCIIMELLEV